MLVRTRRAARCQGAAAIETALIMIPLVMMFFAIFEYGRFAMDLNVLNNAAREGCRYALVNNTSTTITADVKSIVSKRMGTRLQQFTGYEVTVSGTHAGVATPVNDLVPGDMISVHVTGKYNFLNIIPLVKMPATVSINSTVTMVCEGGT